jgi:hypothetical protein
MIAKADLKRLMDNIRIRVPGVLDSMIQLELFNAIENFLTQSLLWVENINFPVFYGTKIGDQTIVEPEAGRIFQLQWVRNSQLIAQRMVMPEEGLLEFVDIPSQDDTWTAQVAITCDDPTTREGYPVVPAWIVNKYWQGMVDGTLSRLYAQPAKPYTSDKLAIFHAQAAASARGRAKGEAAQMNLYRGQPWRFPQQFATKRRGQR